MKIGFSIIFLLTLFAGNVGAQSIGIVTGSNSGTYYQIGLNLKNLGERYGYEVNVYPSTGSLDNVQDVFKRKGVQLGIVQSDVLAFINTEKSSSPELRKIAQNIKLIFPLYNEEVHVLGRGAINSFEDLEGKRVAVGKLGSGTNLTASVMFNLSNVFPAKRLEISEEDAMAALQEGRIDAMFYVAGKPVKLFLNLNIPDLKLVSIQNKKIQQVYPAVEIPAHTYPWQNDAVKTVAVKACLMSYGYQGENCKLIGTFANLVKEYLQWLIDNGHSKWKDAKISYNLPGWSYYDCIEKYANEQPGLKESNGLKRAFEKYKGNAQKQ